ncbi:MAG: dihydrolipoyl dehydrogenase [Aquabacterium sp.]|nr:dihydrolipoyl dehydrogenase [Aquabacterium sp.]
MSAIEVKVPDIGDVHDAAVIEILVKPGDAIRAEQSLITIESDKASMEVPSPQAGVVEAVQVKLGDKVSQGTVILTLRAADEAAPPPSAGAAAAPVPAASVPTAPAEPHKQEAPAAAASALKTPAEAPAEAPAAPAPKAPPAAVPSSAPADLDCDLLVLGAGPGGYSAAFRAADLGLSVVLVERYGELGGVCLNVGCIPSKALLHVAAVMDEARHFADIGVRFGEPRIDLPALRSHKQAVVRKLTGGLAAMAKMRKVTVVRGYGSFEGANLLKVETTDGAGQDKTGGSQTIAFKRAIIAAGSQAVHLPFLPDDPRIVDSTGALALHTIPKRMLVIGGGIIGLEMATVYSSLGARIDVVEAGEALMLGADRDLVAVWQKKNAHRFDNLWLKTRTTAAQATDKGIEVTLEGEGAPTEPQRYDLVLQAVGRTPNGRKIGADRAGVAVDERGYIRVDAQMRTSVPHILAIGDIVGQPMLAHKAVHEGHVAAEVAAGELKGDEALARSAFDARVIPSVAYTDPELAWVGLTEDQAKAQGVAVTKGLFPWAASGRAIANGRDEGFTKLLFDAQTHRIVGGGIVGTHAGDLIGEIALAIEMGADAVDIGRTIHPHPTLGESIGLAAEVAEGSCTDLPPPRKPR